MHRGTHSAGVLHCDISPGNIILTNSGGLLIDWDMSKAIDATQTQRREAQTSTWQFMSAALVSAMFKPMTHTFVDDIESSLWVLMWIFLMYSSCSNKDQAILFLDNTLEPQTQNRQGGYNKADWLKGGTFSNKVFFDGWPALDGLVKQLAHLFGSRYEPPLDKSDQETLKKMLRFTRHTDSFLLVLTLAPLTHISHAYDSLFSHLLHSDSYLSCL